MPWRELSASDAAAVDVVLEGLASGERTVGSSVGAGSPGASERVDRASQVLGLLDSVEPIEPRADLTHRTLSRLRQMHAREKAIQSLESRRLPGLPVSPIEAAAIAAMILIACTLALPTLGQMRAGAMRAACENNLRVVGLAFGQYAQDNLGVLPRGVSQPHTDWWRVGQHHEETEPVPSNSANLFRLVRHHYVHADRLNSPPNPDAVYGLTADRMDWPSAQAISYSYQNQYTADPMRIEHLSQSPLLANRNPLFEISPGLLTMRPDVSPDITSNMHLKPGQNILRSDGSVEWRRAPILEDGDNIWTLEGVDRYRGDETPAGADDAFLVP